MLEFARLGVQSHGFNQHPRFQEVQMRKHSYRSAIFIGLCIYWLIPQAFIIAQTDKGNYPQIGQYETNKSGIFSSIFKNFQEKSVPQLVLDNSTRIESLIQDGKLRLTLADALALALENNLDIAVQRYIPEFSQTDLLRSKAGQSPRGFTGGMTPGGLTAGPSARASPDPAPEAASAVQGELPVVGVRYKSGRRAISIPP